MNRLIIEETSVYELDEECVREKERERRNGQESMEKERISAEEWEKTKEG